MEWPTWVQEWLVQEPLLTRKKLSVSSRLGIDSWVQIKEMDSNSFPINGMWLSKIGGSVSRSMDTKINVGSGNESKSVKDIRLNIESKIGTESQGWGSGSHS